MNEDEDGYGSEAWGEIDYQDLIAAADEVERSTPTKPLTTAPKLQQGPQDVWFLEDDDFDDFLVEEGTASVAVPSLATETEVVDLTSSVETLRAKTPPEPPAGGSRPVVIATIPPRTPPRSQQKRKPTEPLADPRTRPSVEYSGTIFPRFTRTYESELASAVAVAEFSLRLMDILTSVLREFLIAHGDVYPLKWRQAKVNDINRMVRHCKADIKFRGWDFLALANCVVHFRSLMPRFVKDAAGVIERLQVLKTTMRWTFAHTSLQEEERKHPMELSLWAINTLFLIEHLEVSMEYAARVMALHKGLWVRAPEQRSPPPYVSQDPQQLHDSD